MNNIDKFYTESENIGDFTSKYFRYLKTLSDSFNLDSFQQLEEQFEDARTNGRTIFIAGNGGSATTASSMANDIGFDIIKKTGTKVPFRIMALTDNTSVITAISNDVGYNDIFSNQLKIHYSSGDKLLVISASGNSENLVRAVKWVKQQGGKTIGLLGFTGGKLKNLCDTVVHVKSEVGEYGPVEDLHLTINHILAHWFQNKLK